VARTPSPNNDDASEDFCKDLEYSLVLRWYWGWFPQLLLAWQA